jgi:hypothetical protein
MFEEYFTVVEFVAYDCEKNLKYIYIWKVLRQEISVPSIPWVLTPITLFWKKIVQKNEQL